MGGQFPAFSRVCKKHINKIWELSVLEIKSLQRQSSTIFNFYGYSFTWKLPSTILGIKCRKAENLLTKLPTLSINMKLSVILLCSSAMNKVFNTMQIVMARSIKGSFMKAATFFLILNQSGQQSQIRYFKAKAFRNGGHLRWDSSSSKCKRKPHYN